MYAYLDPMVFAQLRGTVLMSPDDADWVQIYASRTLFISLLIGALLYLQHFQLLMIAALVGVVMPITDGLLAYSSGAPNGVVIKHVATVIYLLVTAFVLLKLIRQSAR